MTQVHIRYEGRSLDITSDQLDVGMLSSDAEIRRAVATHLDVPTTKLNNYTIDRNEDSGEITLRPQAVFG